MTISLTGFMGCGKSSVGQRLAALLCCPFMDLDTHIEDAEGESVSRIFSSKGESYFRGKEALALNDLVSKGLGCTGAPELVLALGGGTVTSGKCAKIVHENTICIYLKASVTSLAANLSKDAPSKRPLLAEAAEQGKEAMMRQISLMLEKRVPAYMKSAHIIIDTDGKSVDEIAERIAGEIKSFHPFHACP